MHNVRIVLIPRVSESSAVVMLTAPPKVEVANRSGKWISQMRSDKWEICNSDLANRFSRWDFARLTPPRGIWPTSISQI